MCKVQTPVSIFPCLELREKGRGAERASWANYFVTHFVINHNPHFNFSQRKPKVILSTVFEKKDLWQIPVILKNIFQILDILNLMLFLMA